MNLSAVDILERFNSWLEAWDHHDLNGVLEFMHDEIVFENWNGATVSGKTALEKAWTPWFNNHGNFKFITEDVFIDEKTQKICFQWRLEWPSSEFFYKGKKEIRRGVDVLSLKEGKIEKKYTYSKTSIQIDSRQLSMHVTQKDFASK